MMPATPQLNLEGAVKGGEYDRRSNKHAITRHNGHTDTPGRYNGTPQTKRSRQALEAPTGTSEPVVEAPNGT